MDKIKIRYTVDILLLISFLSVFITGILKFPGLLSKIGIRNIALPFYEISRLHDWSGLIMGILVFVHLVLEWPWIVGVTKSFFKKR